MTFRLDKSDFGFYDNRGRYVVEPGRIDVYAGNSSKAKLTRLVPGHGLIATATRPRCDIERHALEVAVTAHLGEPGARQHRHESVAV